MVTKRNINNKPKTGKKNYRDTAAKQNTRKVIYDIIDKYDELCSQTAEGNQDEAKMYRIKIKNPNRLSKCCISYAKDHPNEILISSDSKLRELINDMIYKDDLIKVDGLIRRNRASLNNGKTTGNIFTIIMKSEFVSIALKELNQRLYAFNVLIQSPCSNMIQIIELGDYTPSMNEELKLKIKQYILELALNNNLTPTETSEHTKYALL